MCQRKSPPIQVFEFSKKSVIMLMGLGLKRFMPSLRMPSAGEPCSGGWPSSYQKENWSQQVNGGDFGTGLRHLSARSMEFYLVSQIKYPLKATSLFHLKDKK